MSNKKIKIKETRKVNPFIKHGEAVIFIGNVILSTFVAYTSIYTNPKIMYDLTKTDVTKLPEMMKSGKFGVFFILVGAMLCSILQNYYYVGYWKLKRNSTIHSILELKRSVQRLSES